MTHPSKHIILGFGGAIGNVLAEELLANHERVKLVSRRGQGMPRQHAGQTGAEAAATDLTNSEDVNRVVEESSMVYLVAGLPYNTAIWREQWPKIMRNVVDACKAKNARLIFFDNVYMYGRVDGPMTEETPVNPRSKKGQVRAKIAEYLLSEIKSGHIVAAIARAADFYGPYSEKGSVPFILAISRLAKGQKALWLVNAKAKHSYTYTGDCGKALYLLAKTENAFNQVWHMPTAHPPITGEEFIRIAAEKLNAKMEFKAMPKWMIRLAGITNPNVRESFEMLYQSEFDYIFDSSKFEKRFNFNPTPYDKGIEETISHFRARGIVS
jgi:nucleoside-diphosphate-sugar epimerase